MNGIRSPKILLMMRHRKNDQGVTQDFVFNVTPADFDNANICRSLMQAIGWFLPRHYTFSGMDEKVLGNGFMPL